MIQKYLFVHREHYFCYLTNFFVLGRLRTRAYSKEDVISKQIEYYNTLIEFAKAEEKRKESMATTEEIRRVAAAKQVREKMDLEIKILHRQKMFVEGKLDPQVLVTIEMTECREVSASL